MGGIGWNGMELNGRDVMGETEWYWMGETEETGKMGWDGME